MDESPSPDEEADLLPFPSCFEQTTFTDAVFLRLVPRDEPNPVLLEELAALFAEAAAQVGNVAPQESLDPVPDDQGVQLRAILDQKAEEIREKAAKAEPQAAVLKKQLEEHGPNANATEVAEARRTLIEAVIELKRQFGIVITARTDGGQ